MNNAAINETIRETIHRSGAKLVSVEAVAKSGEVKRFTFSDAARRTHLQEIVTASGAMAAATRAANNPDLFSVWDIHKGSWRSFHLDNVLSVTANGHKIAFRYYRPR